MPDVNEKITEALQNGETELTLDIAASEDDIRTITDNFSPFWGVPTKYSIVAGFDDVTLGGDSDSAAAEPVDVIRVSFTLEPSLNYYVLRNYKDSSFGISGSDAYAVKLAGEVPEVLSEIFGEDLAGARGSDYDACLAVHDWLVANVSYDETIDQSGIDNGSYGALVGRRTMCQGYAEAFQLLLECVTDIDVLMEVGKGNDSAAGSGGGWVGHAWNLVDIDGLWYHIDATFDDPVSNKTGQVNHYYFGQSDSVMKRDHQWETGFWPASTGESFLYYRNKGFYATGIEEFKDIVKAQLGGGNPELVEVAVEGVEITDEDLQFIFSANRNIGTLYRSYIPMGDVTVVRLTFTYK
jgi:hypothetical protein